VILSLKYGQRFGTWAVYQIEARASVGGTEGVAQFDYGLDVASSDIKNKEATPGSRPARTALRSPARIPGKRRRQGACAYRLERGTESRAVAS